MTTTPEAAAANAAAALAAYVQAPVSDPFVAECAAEAEELVTGLVTGAPRNVPPTLRARAVKETGAELYNRRTARGGVMAFGEGDAGIVTTHVRTDVLVPARALLGYYLGPGIA